jgi:hypothetical protein
LVCCRRLDSDWRRIESADRRLFGETAAPLHSGASTGRLGFDQAKCVSLTTECDISVVWEPLALRDEQVCVWHII